jgi:hypothetical protein
MIDYGQIMKKKPMPAPYVEVTPAKGSFAELEKVLGDPIQLKQKMNQIKMKKNPRPMPNQVGFRG